MKINKISQILFILFLTIKFKPLECHEISFLKNYEKIKVNDHEKMETDGGESPVTATIAENSTFSDEKITSKTNLDHSQRDLPVEKQEDGGGALNRSVEYLIEAPNNSNHQEVIIKPLNDLCVTNLSWDMSNQTNLQTQNTVHTLKTTLTGSQSEEITETLHERKEEVIINLLKPPHKEITTSILQESIISSDKQDTRQQITSENQNSSDATSIKESQLILKDHIPKESTMTFIKLRINPLNQILNILTKRTATFSNNTTTTVSQSIDTPTNDEKQEEFKSVNHELNATSKHFEDLSTEHQKKEDFTSQPIVTKSELISQSEDTENSTVSLLQTVISQPSWAYGKSEEEVSTTKSLTTLEDYAVKQMNFILDHILLESQEFVAKVLQATSSTTFQRDHLKRYAENINRLLNTQPENNYSDDDNSYELKPVTELDLYEEVVKKLNFIKSKATKQLQNHLPLAWIKDYKDTKEELKLWLDKSANEMHREFNLYLNDEVDHIKYLYFNESFDDIIRATEIHQKLALLADLIKIVKNKKQITFMDLYMQ